jgi:hypothetical protein
MDGNRAETGEVVLLIEFVRQIKAGVIAPVFIATQIYFFAI